MPPQPPLHPHNAGEGNASSSALEAAGAAKTVGREGRAARLWRAGVALSGSEAAWGLYSVVQLQPAAFVPHVEAFGESVRAVMVMCGVDQN